MAVQKQPWKPSDATRIVNRISKELLCEFSYTKHAKERMAERGLIISDVLFVLRDGYVYAEPEESTIEGFYKYQVEGKSPNSSGRSLRIVAVPDPSQCQIKVVTIMWKDGS